MSYLIYGLNKPARGIAALTGTADAKPGHAAISGDGDIYVMNPNGWQKVWDHATGGTFTPVIPLPSNQAIVTDGDTLEVTGGTVTLAVAANVVTATYEAGE